MMVTLKNIAENAGVSIGTVSTVLNKKRGAIRVSPATQLRVMEVAKRLKYMPNTMARGLRTGRSYLIGVLISSHINTSFVPELIQGIEEVLLEQHLGMLLLTYKDLSSMSQMADFMVQKHVDAAIVIPDSRKEYWPVYERMMKNQPTVGVGGSSIGIDLPRVYVCPKEVGEIAVDYLQQLGHKKIGVLGPNGERYQYLLETLEKSGIPYDPDLHILNCSDFESGKAAVEQYVTRKNLPTAVFCNSDEIAAGFISGAAHNGIKIPDQISVIGTNDTDISRMLTPLLTSIGQPKAEQGVQAARLALNLLAGKKADKNQIVLSPYLVERESCKSII
jgi:LacI family transcriptional regulator, galactose operon repressor